jgi:serine/threonine protein kinase
MDNNEENNFVGDKFSDFEVLQVLYENDFGFVAKVKSKKNLKIYAMKKTDLSLIEDQNFRKYSENEHIFMKKLDHPNVCKLYNTFKEGDIIYI